jgi:hypothetical protein
MRTALARPSLAPTSLLGFVERIALGPGAGLQVEP